VGRQQRIKTSFSYKKFSKINMGPNAQIALVSAELYRKQQSSCKNLSENQILSLVHSVQGRIRLNPQLFSAEID